MRVPATFGGRVLVAAVAAGLLNGVLGVLIGGLSPRSLAIGRARQSVKPDWKRSQNKRRQHAAAGEGQTSNPDLQ